MAESVRVKTGCAGLDTMLRGGLIPGSAALVEGSAGTGKTTLALQFLMQGVAEGQPGVLFAFEQFPEQYYDCAAELGWDLRALGKEGKLEVVFTSPENFMEDIAEPEGKIAALLARRGAKRVVVDSMTHFERLAGDVGALRAVETEVVNSLKREGATVLLLKENANVLGRWDAAVNKIPFIADAYLLLRYLEVDSEIKRCLMILKMRGSDHDKDIVEYAIGPGGLSVAGKFQGISGIFLGTGIPTRQGSPG